MVVLNIARNFIENKDYKYLSLSDVLRYEFKKSKDISQIKIRNNLQEFGNALREKHGNDFLAKRVAEIIKTDSEQNKWVVDSIRNTHEIEYLRSLPGNFYLMSIWADKDTRWNRVKDKYNSKEDDFNRDDKRDSNEKIENGQQITLCYQMADVVALNKKELIKDSEDYNNFAKIIEKYISLFEGNTKFEPTENETLMTMAYANSMRSSCSQRKVGALIRDDCGNVFSSGYNEVPSSERSCKLEYGKCYRKYLRGNFDNKVDELLSNDDDKNQIKNLYKKEFKNLDYCRALHAEENAIVNMARMGVSFQWNERLYIQLHIPVIYVQTK